MLSDNSKVSVMLVDYPLFYRRTLFAELNHQYLRKNLETELAHFNYMEAIARTFINPSRQNQFKQEISYNNDPRKRKAVAIITNSAVAVLFKKNLATIDNFI